MAVVAVVFVVVVVVVVVVTIEVQIIWKKLNKCKQSKNIHDLSVKIQRRWLQNQGQTMSVVIAESEHIEREPDGIQPFSKLYE